MASEAVVEEDKDRKPESRQEEMLAIVGDLMRSISLIQYYPQHDTLEEVARDFNANWTTALSMLTDDVYIGAENWNNLFVLRRNVKAQSEEVRCRLDTVGEFCLGEMCNKFMSGSLVMPSSSNESSKPIADQSRRRTIASPTKKSSKAAGSSGRSPAASRSKKPAVCVGSQTLFGTVDGTLGVILGLDSATAAFFSCLEKAMEQVIMPIGNFSHRQFRAFKVGKRRHPSHGFVDGDLVESFLDLDKTTMELVVQHMNKDGTWDIANSSFSAQDDKGTDGETDEKNRLELSVDDVLAVVEEMTMLH
jgi:DNA damage-binding protein 1